MEKAVIMRHGIRYFVALTIALLLSGFSRDVPAMTAAEILEQVVLHNFGDGVRLAVSTRTFKGSKLVSQHALWVVAKSSKEETTLFLDFDEPPESKGMRFLFIMRPGKPPEAYSYLPAARKTLPLAVEDEGADIGGTGLTMQDIQVAVAEEGQKESILREEKIAGRDCYVIEIILPQGKGKRLVWVSKEGFHVLKSEHRDKDGKIVRSVLVVEYFKTKQGIDWPREEVIEVPPKGLKIVMRQDNAVMGIQIPPEILKPETFGDFKWLK